MLWMDGWILCLGTGGTGISGPKLQSCSSAVGLGSAARIPRQLNMIEVPEHETITIGSGMSEIPVPPVSRFGVHPSIPR